MISKRKFIDIGANLLEPAFYGIYNDKYKHLPDYSQVLERARNVGIQKIIVTGIYLTQCTEALRFVQSYDMLYTTVGCHPTHCSDFDNENADKYLEDLIKLATSDRKVVAIGECGLDYDRLHFCEKGVQKRYFEKQLLMSERVNLPYFLHCRNAAEDFISIVSKYNIRGVVHSFDGSLDTMRKLVELGFYIGINGCSLKTEENLQVAREIPRDRLMIETDAPWCDVRPTHASFRYVKTHFPSSKKEKWQENAMVKGRNEPCTIVQILEVLAAARNDDESELANQIYENTEKLFFGSVNPH